MFESMLRAPYAMLRELLGEAKPGAEAGDKCSTCFIHVRDGLTVIVHDFHKEEWGGTPECRTDPKYVWRVAADDDVEPFCRWLSGEIVKRMSSPAGGGRALDAADREKLNKLVAGGMSIGDAMKQVRTVAAGDPDAYRWPV
jgi:hypothetical protein